MGNLGSWGPLHFSCRLPWIGRHCFWPDRGKQKGLCKPHWATKDISPVLGGIPSDMSASHGSPMSDAVSSWAGLMNHTLHDYSVVDSWLQRRASDSGWLLGISDGTTGTDQSKFTFPGL